MHLTGIRKQKKDHQYQVLKDINWYKKDPTKDYNKGDLDFFRSI